MRTYRAEILEIAPLLAADQRAAFVRDVRHGLTSDPKRLHSLYFYDDVGMMLFQRIMELPEYYLTRAETEILCAHAGAIAARFAGHPVVVIDLGAGDATKTDLILNALRDAGCTVTYIPVDISRATLEHLVERFIEAHTGIAVRPVAAEYFDALRTLHTVGDERRLIVFLGSNIGNFPPDRAAEFLVKLRPHVREHDALLVGFDLQKDPAMILRAYNDATGVTAEFNFNLLDRINRELGGDFDRRAFRHYAMYDPLKGVARSFLVSARAQRVRVADVEETIAFEAGEAIHTEDSWKYSQRNIRTFASVSGFSIAAEYMDEEKRFVDVVLA
jgi:L-histidine N-alpha-methyltransferase